MRTKRLTWLLGAGVIIAGALGGCPGAQLKGTVTDTRGERLPGVAVVIESEHGSETQTLSNALGEYALPSVAGRVRLSFLKNGYTAGHLEADVEAGGDRALPEMALWPLPPEAGIFLYEAQAYRRTTAVMPRPLISTAGNAVVFGLSLMLPVEETSAAEPFLVLHRVPGFEVQVTRLCTAQVFVTGNAGATQEVWVAERPTPASIEAVDEPERLLQQITFAQPLEPGTYAVHWGALTGHDNIETRAFVFKVAAPPGSEPGGQQPGPEAQAKPANGQAKAKPVTADGPEPAPKQ